MITLNASIENRDVRLTTVDLTSYKPVLMVLVVHIAQYYSLG